MTVSQLLASADWRVSAAGTSSHACDPASCCCFAGAVNTFQTPATNELNFNGSVTGTACDAPVKQARTK